MAGWRRWPAPRGACPASTARAPPRSPGPGGRRRPIRAPPAAPPALEPRTAGTPPSPHTAALAGAVGVPAGVGRIVRGDGPSTGACLVRHPGVDTVGVAGAPRAGGEVVRLGSGPVEGVTLEVGGEGGVVARAGDFEEALWQSTL